MHAQVQGQPLQQTDDEGSGAEQGSPAPALNLAPALASAVTAVPPPPPSPQMQPRVVVAQEGGALEGSPWLMELRGRSQYEFAWPGLSGGGTTESRAAVGALGRFRVGTTQQLLELLTSASPAFDAPGCELLLLTSRLPPATMLELLARRFLLPDSVLGLCSAAAVRDVRSSTLCVMRRWLEMSLTELDHATLSRVWQFLEEIVTPTEARMGRAVQSALLRAQRCAAATLGDLAAVLNVQMEESSSHVPPPVVSLLPADVEYLSMSAFGGGASPEPEPEPSRAAITSVEEAFWALPARSLARQLALVEHAQFALVRRLEWLSCGQPAVEAGEGGVADHIERIARRSDAVARWVAASVGAAQARAAGGLEALRKWIEVAKECHRLHNLSGLAEIVQGLGSAAAGPAWERLQCVSVSG